MHRPTKQFRLFGPALFGAAALLLTAPLGQAQPVGSRLSAPYPEATRGEAAVLSLGDRVAAVAAQNELSVDEMLQLLRSDETAWLDTEDRIFFLDIPAARPEDTSGSFINVSIPTSDAFKLHSRPGANRIIYLDFTGHHSVNNIWGHNIVFPPFNTEGSSSSFTEGELNSIIAHWQYIAEDFAPFEVDVTTEEPPIDRLIKSGFGDQQWGVRDLHTQATGGFGNGIGGVAYVNSYNDNKDNPVFTFNKGNNNGSMSGSHEVGHSLGLYHDGVGGSSYHSGVGGGLTSWGPIMGAPFGKHLVQWSNGDYSSATNTEDDYTIITKSSNGLTFKSDDFGDSLGTATPIAPVCPDLSVIFVDGLIESRTDKDAFRFESAGGPFTVNVTPTDPGGNLDISLELYGPSGTLISSNNPTNAATASLSGTLAAGTHTVIIDGVGKSGVYSDYGSVGVYTLSVIQSSASSFTNLGSALAGTTTPTLAGVGFGCAGSSVALNLTGAVANAPAYLTYGASQLNLPFMGGILVPNILSGGGLVLLQTNGGGAIPLAASLPAAIPASATAVFQYWIVDAGGPQGFAASNAVALELQ